MLTLYHLQMSPYAEKARWALEYKRLEWKGRLLVPGRHADVVERIAGTRTVPVLVDSDAEAPITDSTDILAHLETIAPQPPLFPSDPRLRQRVADLEDWLDEQVARPVSRFNYNFISQSPRAFVAYFTRGLSARQRLATLLLRPVLPRMIRRFREQRGLGWRAAEGFRQEVHAAFDRIEALLDVSSGDYLLGREFTAADLTAGSVMAPALRLAGSPWEPSARELAGYPGGVEPAEVAAYRDELRQRPGGLWLFELWQARASRRV